VHPTVNDEEFPLDSRFSVKDGGNIKPAFAHKESSRLYDSPDTRKISTTGIVKKLVEALAQVFQVQA
jgi:hypothetical protein